MLAYMLDSSIRIYVMKVYPWRCANPDGQVSVRQDDRSNKPSKSLCRGNRSIVCNILRKP
jgi:hypothetical protein